MPRTTPELRDIDAELHVVQTRILQERDSLIRSLISIDTLSSRADVLLDRRLLLLADVTAETEPAERLPVQRVRRLVACPGTRR